MGSHPQKPKIAQERLSIPNMSFPPREESRDLTKDALRRHDDRRPHECHATVDKQWQNTRQATINHMNNLEDQKHRLKEQEERLIQELAAIRSRAAIVKSSYDLETQRLRSLEASHLPERDAPVRRDYTTEKDARDWFKESRSNDVIITNRPRPPAPSIDSRPAEGQWNSVTLPPLANLNLNFPRQYPPDDRLVAIIDAAGTIIDKLRSSTHSNDRHDSISARPILRPVKLRNGRQFLQDEASKIYDYMDEKGIRWVACMIQATGTVQAKPCQACRQNEGPFIECVVTRGSQFPKCGNCEWKNQHCRGLESLPVNDADLPLSESCNLAPLQSDLISVTSSSPSLAKLGTMSGALTRGSKEATAAAALEATMKISEPVSKSPLQALASAFKPVNSHTQSEPHSPQPEKYVFPSLSGPGSCHEDSFPPSCPTSRQMTPSTTISCHSPMQDCADITQKNLLLRHNGFVYTNPKCVEGVPLEKICPGHPYWDPKWPDLRSVVTPVLNQWQEKHSSVMHDRNGKGGSVKYQYGRQVNRGKTILEFLEHGEISPYQLLSKKYMTVGRGSITSYDTLFRLCETIGELSRYKLDVEPVEWLRQRLHELIEAQGAAFNFSKTIHDFYNDAKLAALRIKSGFRNIGRPSGVKMPRRRTSEASPRSLKRKPSPAAEYAGEIGDDGPSSKRRKAAATNILDSLETGEVSDTDSWCGVEIGPNEFRLYQAKTRLFTSSEQDTQYWIWQPHQRLFEHQLLKWTDPIEWAVLGDPIDFSLRLEDVVKAAWNLKSLRVYLVMSDRQICFEDDRPRGDMMVSFKRENTMRRFIQFCRSQGIELVEETWKKMENLWASMDSKKLAGGREETSARLKEELTRPEQSR